MRNHVGALLLCLMMFALPLEAAGPLLSTLVLNARYVAMGYETTDGFISENNLSAFQLYKIQPEDRQALDNVSRALAKWKRYAITLDPHNADLLIAVRSGRLASGRVGIHIPSGPASVGPAIGGEVGPPNDYLAVYQSDNGHEGAKLWQQSEEDGLEGSDPSLLASYKNDVESLAKKQAAKKK